MAQGRQCPQRASTKTLPAIQPIISELQATPFDHRDWVFEPKYDAYRGLLYVTRKGCSADNWAGQGRGEGV